MLNNDQATLINLEVLRAILFPYSFSLFTGASVAH